MTAHPVRTAHVAMRALIGAVILLMTVATGASAQDWTDGCQGRIEAMLLPTALDGEFQNGDPARVRAIIVNDCDPNHVWFVVTDGTGATFLAQGGEIILDDRPGG